MTDSIESKYQKKTQLEHILTRPDTYVGDIKLQTERLYIHTNGRIVKQEIQYVPALYKIFDEIIVNASDHSKNDNTCKNIKITISNDEISVYNDGVGIDVEIHKEYKIYVPELIFGELLTSTNYDDTQKRITGGRNGYGAKLTNIFSTFFSIETVDGKRKRKFYQEFTNNMSKRTKPTITDLKVLPITFTKILFKPDFKKFGIDELTSDMIALFEKRVYDLAGTLENVNVYLNDKLIPLKTFQDYIKLYFDSEDVPDIIYEKNTRWEISYVYRPDGGFEHISHVNNICTYHGGSHVDYINDQIIDNIQKQIEKKNKDAINKIKSHSIKDHYMIFINCTIENPSFTSQTKETLKTKQSEFGSTCELSDKFVKKINTCGILNVLLDYLKFKEESLLMKKTDGKKVNAIKGIPKLEDAEWAGTKKSLQCKLILTEGDSAKALAMSGRAVVGNQKYGIFPLKGKLLNVRGASPKELLGNEEIINLKKILGLKHGVKYISSGKDAKDEDNNSKVCDVSELRYGGIITLCDQDSVTGDTPLLLKKNNILDIVKIEDLTNNWQIDEINNKQYGLSDYQIWTDKGWTNIVKVIKHKVNKKIYRVLTHTGVVDVTEDHSLLNENGEEVSPKDIEIGGKLLHDFPMFEQFKTHIPDNLENMNINQLFELASTLKIRLYNKQNKSTLINNINKIKDKYYHNFDNNTYNITANEAYAMGLFFADGSCGTYYWDYNYKNKDRPKEYTMHRESITWAISNTNLDFLNKAKEKLEMIYNYEFKIIQCKVGDNQIDSYKLIVNGGKSSKDFVDKYRKLFYCNFETDKTTDKKVPIEILNNTYEIRNEFFNGFYDGDGCKVKETKFFDVCSKITTQGLFLLCKSLGYQVSINHQERKLKVYILTITKGFQQFNPNQIKKIIDLGVQECDVYDLETENHHFQAGVGQMIVHNTDGFHIKGLLINFFEYFWPSLLKIDGFITCLATPIVKASKGKDVKIFYNLTEYNDWREKASNGYHIKYYKGLGTSTRDEGKEYFANLEEKLIHYLWRPTINEESKEQENNQESETSDIVEVGHPCHDAIILAFDKKKADDRKVWLMNYDKDEILTPDIKKVPYNDFVNKELIHFSNDDIKRSIPSMVDGLKPSQRKILYGTILRKLFTKQSEIKVAQLTGFISDKTCYHHGEQSLNMAIINMAQRFVGSNNINILVPSGQFGTRLTSKDFASPRYIFTYLNPIVRKIYREEDDPILNYMDDDGTPIEPEYYLPIIPMVLVNGAEGIGTGFSTQILPYNPLDLIDNIKNMMNDKPLKDLKPYFHGFKGKISQEEKTYSIMGNYECIGSDLIITELPVGTWTTVYKEFLNDLEEKKEITKFTNENTDEHVNFKITLDGKTVDDLSEKELVQKFKLIKKISITNMHLYNKDDKIQKYGNVNDILREFYYVRLEGYTKRKEYFLGKYKKELDLLKWKMKFIEDVLVDKIVVNRKKREDIVAQLTKKNYPTFGDEKYDYLLTLPIHSFTYEKIEELKEKIENKEEEIDLLDSKSEKEIWMDELDELKEVYVKEYQPTDTNVTMTKTVIKTNMKITKAAIEKSEKAEIAKAKKKVVAKKPAVKKTTKK